MNECQVNDSPRIHPTRSCLKKHFTNRLEYVILSFHCLCFQGREAQLQPKKKKKKKYTTSSKILHKREFLFQRVRLKTVINRRECLTEGKEDFFLKMQLLKTRSMKSPLPWCWMCCCFFLTSPCPVKMTKSLTLLFTSF